jgi:2'-5' RNA ligase
LHAGVDDACAAVGLPREGRPFRPHLTVGRVRPGRRPDPRLGAALGGVGLVAAARVTSLHLMASDLTPAGARHTPLGVYDLTPAGAPPDVPPDAPR